MFRQIVWLFAAATLALVAAAPSAADKPIRERAPFGDSFTYDAGDPCAFPLSVSAVEDKEYATVFFDKEGTFLRVHGAGRLVLQFTNALTGKSIVVNVSGPVRITVNPDGSNTVALSGVSFLHLNHIADAPAGIPVPSALITRGPSVTEVAFGPSGLERETLIQAPPQWFNVCDVLAS
jgi:hypothetical protein